MPAPIYLPKFDPQHEESQILNWLVGEGDSVMEGDPVCEVETDKVNMEIEAPADGRIAGIRYREGDVAPAAQIIAYVLLEGETPADLPDVLAQNDTGRSPDVVETESPDSQMPTKLSPVAERIVRSENIDLRRVTGSGPGGRIMRRDVETQAGVSPGRVRATPAARALARQHDLDLSVIAGTGPRGRVQSADVQMLVEEQAAISVPQTIVDGKRTVSLTGTRQRIARRLQQSYQTAPHIFVEMPVDMTQVEQIRHEMKTEGESTSVTAVLVSACARTLKRHPTLNATLDNDVATLWDEVNMGIAVALDDGLVVPVLQGADQLRLSEVQARSDDLIARARAGQLRPDDVASGTFTISNLGMFGVSRFTAIINPPQVAILAVGRIYRQFVPDEDDQPIARSMMNLVLSVDHRLVDGADAAHFLGDLRKGLEQPLRLL